MGFGSIVPEIGITCEETAKLMDEMEDYCVAIGKEFYVLKSLDEYESIDVRVKMKNLSQYLPVIKMRNKTTPDLDRETVYFEMEGSYYPDYIEERGVYLFSKKFVQYLRFKLDIRNYEVIKVGLVSESGKRVEEYSLIIPDELECVLEGTAQMNKDGSLGYFEIDEKKTGQLQIFRVKGFPHLIVTEKLNRIDFAGFTCSRIENFFDYEGERDRQYLYRSNGEYMVCAQKKFERLAKDLGQEHVVYHVRCSLNIEKLRREINDGFKSIFDSYRGIDASPEALVDRFLLFFYSWQDGSIRLADTHHEQFARTKFTLTSLVESGQQISAIKPDLLGAWQKVCFEAVLHYATLACSVFERYDGVHQNLRFRLYLQESPFQSLNPPLIHDYKPKLQREIEMAADLRHYDVNFKDCREYNFSGKNLNGRRIEGSDLRRTRFNGANLDKVDFLNCNLTGAEFINCSLKNAVFSECTMDRTCFDGADMRGVEIKECKLYHTRFIKSNLTETKIRNSSITKTFFYNTRLFDAFIQISQVFSDNIFRLCDFRGAAIEGDEGSVLAYCDYRNSDLTGCRFRLGSIVHCIFLKSRLSHADFSACDYIGDTEFRWTNGVGVALSSEIICSDFSFADFSQAKVKNLLNVQGNNFYHANFAGYGFSGALVRSNSFVLTNLSDCNLKEVRLDDGKLIMPNLQGACLIGAKIRQDQLEFVELSSKQQRDVIIREMEDE